MPTVIDETVAPVAYDTSGNGGRKIVNSSTGDKVFVVKNGTTEFRLYKKVGNNAPVLLATQAVTTLVDVCIENVGNGYVGILYSYAGSTIAYRTVSVALGTLSNQTNVDVGQSAVGNVTMIANDAKTELSMAVATKNATLSNSWNIRFNKGTIATDGSVAWGAVEQVTKFNNTLYTHNNPSIVLNSSGIPTILVETSGTYITGVGTFSGGGYSITVLKRDNTLFYEQSYTSAGWSAKTAYNTNSANYAQSSPSAIFVPQFNNGLANGRIWVAWHGTDSTDTGANNIRTSYSDDGGVTWNAMQKLTSGTVYSQLNASLTADKNNKVYLIFQGIPSAGNPNIQVRLMTYTTSWSAPVEKTSLTVNDFVYPSALFDLSLSVASPLFIYKNHQTASVKFSGTWTVTTISVTQGSIGTKTSPSNVLTYAITTDGTMSTITEKVNGVTIGTKTATSGQSQIVGLSQAQWDAVKFGKYKDITAGLNTLTIEMGTETFTYTFDKHPATDADMISVAKAVQDSANVYLPAVKSKLGTAIRAKGGTVSDTDSLEVMASAIGGIYSPKKASGTIYVATNSTATVSGLSFKPRIITTFTPTATFHAGTTKNGTAWAYGTNFGDGAQVKSMPTFNGTTWQFVISTGGSLPSGNVEWIADE